MSNLPQPPPSRYSFALNFNLTEWLNKRVPVAQRARVARLLDGKDDEMTSVARDAFELGRQAAEDKYRTDFRDAEATAEGLYHALDAKNETRVEVKVEDRITGPIFVVSMVYTITLVLFFIFK